MKTALSVCFFISFVFSRGKLPDSESMLRFHRVPEDRPNPHNQIVFRLPGAQGLRDWMFDKWRATMDEWRRQIHLPPKQSDLWRSAKELNLYGYEDDDDEEALMSGDDSGRKGPGGCVGVFV